MHFLQFQSLKKKTRKGKEQRTEKKTPRLKTMEKKQSGRERSYHATRCTTLKRTIIEKRSEEVEEDEGDKKRGGGNVNEADL